MTGDLLQRLIDDGEAYFDALGEAREALRKVSVRDAFAIETDGTRYRIRHVSSCGSDPGWELVDGAEP